MTPARRRRILTAAVLGLLAAALAAPAREHALRASAAEGGGAIPAATGSDTSSGPRLRRWIWISPAQLRRLPESGPAWEQVLAAADSKMGHADLSDQDETHDTTVLAVALVYARTGEERYRRKAAAGIMDAIDTEHGGRTLALARGLLAYVVAANLIDLHDWDAAQDGVFRKWLDRVRFERLEPDARPTLIATHERAPNNWGAHAGASRMAADVYLGDAADLARAAAVFKGYLGDRSAYRGFRFGADDSWQADPSAPVGVLPVGARKDGHDLSGALPDDMRRGCSFRWPPCGTRYPWEALQGLTAQAEILFRQGYDAYDWQHQAIRRATEFLLRLNRRFPDDGWATPNVDEWLLWLLNDRYGLRVPVTATAGPGRGMGFTGWTHARRPCPDLVCRRPSAPLRLVVPIVPPESGGRAAPDLPSAGLGAAVLAIVAGLLRILRSLL
jgi:Alginate lyase